MRYTRSSPTDAATLQRLGLDNLFSPIEVPSEGGSRGGAVGEEVLLTVPPAHT